MRASVRLSVAVPSARNPESKHNQSAESPSPLYLSLSLNHSFVPEIATQYGPESSPPHHYQQPNHHSKNKKNKPHRQTESRMAEEMMKSVLTISRTPSLVEWQDCRYCVACTVCSGKKKRTSEQVICSSK